MNDLVFVPDSRPQERLIGYAIDILEIVADGGIAKVRIAGWVAGRGRPIQAVTFHSGYASMRLDVASPRPDVVAAFPAEDVALNCGFDGVINVSSLGAAFSLIVTAVQQSGSHSGETMVWLGEICGRQEPLTAGPLGGRLAPICVTALGRTGSTVMMKLLGAHPDILVAGRHPFETRYAQDAFRSLFEVLETFLPGDAEVTGTAAYSEFCGETKQNLLRTVTSRIEGFYGTHVRAQGKTTARFFAEKCTPSFMPNIASDVYGRRAKEIIIVRDPRDTFCSAKDFNRVHGWQEFAAAAHETDAEWYSFIYHYFVQVAECRERRPEALAVRYEDLIGDSRNTIVRILHHLDVRDNDGIVDAIEACISRPDSTARNHMTSSSATDSVGRWRRYENPGIFEADDATYFDAMRAFGYL